MKRFFTKFLVGLAVLASVSGSFSLINAAPTHATCVAHTATGRYYDNEVGMGYAYDTKAKCEQVASMKSTINTCSLHMSSGKWYDSSNNTGPIYDSESDCQQAVAYRRVTSSGSSSSSNPAESYSCRYLLGMVSWDCGVDSFDSESALISNIWQIASNVLTDMTVIATYLVLGFVIYGGYLYIFAAGDVGKVASGKKTLTRAFIGLAIVLLSNVILNTIRIALLGQRGVLSDCVSTDCIGGTHGSQLANNLIAWFIGTAGVVAAIFVAIGGVGYVTSSGDASKLQKSKNTILYALIGLAICALAQVITAFVFNIINDSNTSYQNTTLIAKEQIYEQNH